MLHIMLHKGQLQFVITAFITLHYINFYCTVQYIALDNIKNTIIQYIVNSLFMIWINIVYF